MKEQNTGFAIFTWQLDLYQLALWKKKNVLSSIPNRYRDSVSSEIDHYRLFIDICSDTNKILQKTSCVHSLTLYFFITGSPIAERGRRIILYFAVMALWISSIALLTCS